MTRTPAYHEVRSWFQSRRQSDPASAAHAWRTASRTIAGDADEPGSSSRPGSCKTSAIIWPVPGRIAIQGHGQRQLVEPRRSPATDRPDAQEPEGPRETQHEQGQPRGQAQAKGPVEEDQHGRRRDQHGRRVDGELQGELAPQPPPQSRELGAQGPLLLAERLERGQFHRGRHGSRPRGSLGPIAPARRLLRNKGLILIADERRREPGHRSEADSSGSGWARHGRRRVPPGGGVAGSFRRCEASGLAITSAGPAVGSFRIFSQAEVLVRTCGEIFGRFRAGRAFQPGVRSGSGPAQAGKPDPPGLARRWVRSVTFRRPRARGICGEILVRSPGAGRGDRDGSGPSSAGRSSGAMIPGDAVVSAATDGPRGCRRTPAGRARCRLSLRRRRVPGGPCVQVRDHAFNQGQQTIARADSWSGGTDSDTRRAASRWRKYSKSTFDMMPSRSAKTSGPLGSRTKQQR